MTNKNRLAPLAIVMGLSVTFSAHAQMMILSSHGPSARGYSPGAILLANHPISLMAGDRLEMLVGQTSKVLIGPLNIKADQIDAASRKNLGDVFKRAPADIAAVRGGLQFGTEPTLWQWNVEGLDLNGAATSDRFCLTSELRPTLWRYNAVRDGNLSIRDLATGNAYSFAWPRGEHLLSWPEKLSSSDVRRYAATLDEGPHRVLEWRVLPRTPQSLTDLAASLLDQSCFEQAAMLRERLGIIPR